MPYPTPHRPKPSQLNFIWQFVVIALLIVIGAAVLVQNWQINLAVSFLGMTSVALPLSLLMAIAFGSGLIVAWTISAVNSWANANRFGTAAQTTPRWGNSSANAPDAPSTKPNSPQNNPPQNKPPTQAANQRGGDRYDNPVKVSEPLKDTPRDTTKAQTGNPSPSPSPSPRISMRDSQKIPPDPAPTPQPIREKRPSSQEPDWIDESEEWESEDEWEEEYDDDWDDDAPDDDEPEDPDTVPYGTKPTSKSSKSKRPPLQAKYIRW
ncbi:MAG: hypothetical protein ACK456_02405 [Pseudanabaenaceae cyanobacterium]